MNETEELREYAKALQEDLDVLYDGLFDLERILMEDGGPQVKLKALRLVRRLRGLE